MPTVPRVTWEMPIINLQDLDPATKSRRGQRTLGEIIPLLLSLGAGKKELYNG